MKDLFEHYEELPPTIQHILEQFEEDEGDLYGKCRELEQTLKPHGYTFDWGLDGVPFNLRKL